MEKNEKNKTTDKAEKKGFPGYPIYPSSEDVYGRLKEETELDPEDPNKIKSPVEEDLGRLNAKNFNGDVSGADLDIPGSELDDLQESVGSEDEENNGYSLGGDNHESQEENTGRE